MTSTVLYYLCLLESSLSALAMARAFKAEFEAVVEFVKVAAKLESLPGRFECCHSTKPSTTEDFARTFDTVMVVVVA